MALTDLPNENQPKHRPSSPLRSILPYTSILVIIAAIYVAWTFYSRYQANRNAQASIEAKKAAHEKAVVDQIYGSGEVKFTAFSADNGRLKRGETTELCYGVVNATSVKIDPPIEPLKPTFHHCMEIAPKKTTTYKITADDGKGHTKSASLTIHVQ